MASHAACAGVNSAGVRRSARAGEFARVGVPVSVAEWAAFAGTNTVASTKHRLADPDRANPPCGAGGEPKVTRLTRAIQRASCLAASPATLKWKTTEDELMRAICSSSTGGQLRIVPAIAAS